MEQQLDTIVNIKKVRKLQLTALQVSSLGHKVYLIEQNQTRMTNQSSVKNTIIQGNMTKDLVIVRNKLNIEPYLSTEAFIDKVKQNLDHSFS